MEKKCRKCKVVKSLDAFGLYPRSKDGHYYYCKPCKLESNKKYDLSAYSRTHYQKHKEERLVAVRKRETLPERRYDVYKRNAEKRDILFDITLAEFLTFWQKDCTYCHDQIVTIGLDRINNDPAVGYVTRNVVSCCSVCNYVRGDEFTYEEMVNDIGPAIARIKQKRNNLSPKKEA